MGLGPLPHFIDQRDRGIAVEWLGVEKIRIAQRNCVDREIIESVGTRSHFSIAC